MFASVADRHRFGLRRQPGAARRSQVLAKELVALEADVILGQATPGTTALQADAGRVAVPMTTPGTAASRFNFLLKSLRSRRPLRPAWWQVLACRERAAAGRGAPIADCPKSANRSLLVYGHRRDVDHAQTGLAQTRRFLLLFQSAAPPAALSAAFPASVISYNMSCMLGVCDERLI